MNISIKRIACLLTALVLLCCALPLTAWAEAGTETTATAAPATVKLDQLRVKGSNGKIYLATPNLSDGVNAYSFGVPNWMETVTITFTGKEGIAATCSNGQSVVANGTNYSVGMDLTENAQKVTLSLKQGDLTRSIEITVNRRQIDCYIEDILVFNGDNEITPTGDAGDGKMTFTLPSGALNGIKLRVKPRHEDTVTISNITKKQDGEAVTDGEKTKLKLNQYATYYPTDLCDTESFDKLVEGTNRYYIEVKAGNITRTCDVTIIVGDPNANAPTTTTTTTTTTAPSSAPTQPTTATLPSSTQQTIPGTQSGNSAGSMLSSIPPVLWILIGIIALVVIGSCIFMIVNMSAGSRRGGGYNNYNYDYDYGPQRPRRRRNLTEYLDDEYDDYGYERGRGGRYDDYDDYDRAPRRGGRYDSYDDYDDYEPPRRSRYDDYDDYDDGYGGY